MLLLVPMAFPFKWMLTLCNRTMRYVFAQAVTECGLAYVRQFMILDVLHRPFTKMCLRR